LGTGFGAAGESAAPAEGKAIDRLFRAGEEERAYFGGEGLRRIEIRIAGANARIAAADTYAAEVVYRAERSNVRLIARVENGTLFIKEAPEFTSPPSVKPSELTVTIPRREYEDFSVTLAAGSVRADGMTAKRFDGEIMSGSAAFGAYAEEIVAIVRSGHMELRNPVADRAAKSLKVNCFSGTSAVRGFFAERYEIEQKSGVLTVEGLSGTGEIRVKSGIVQVGYAEWNGDLSADLASGSLKLLLPSGSGAYLNTSVTSGNITVALDNETATLGRGKSNLKIGGANLHALNAGITSGSIRVGNGGTDGESSAPDLGQGAVGSPLPPAPPPSQNKKRPPYAGKIVGALCLDLFLFSWALPTLAALVTTIFACAASIGVSGITSMIGGTMMGVTDVSSWFSSGFSPISTVLLGATLVSGAVLLFLVAIKAATGFINLILSIVNLHTRAFAGRNVCTPIGRKRKNTETAGKAGNV
ncbi:MAG: DUF4097 domain-containing protein, partial [Eubacterium sp.]|nr:DUF4097 domain-containing protein [Eubacterium sp.]